MTHQTPGHQRSEKTNFYGYPVWMEGPTDAESPWQGEVVRLEAVTAGPGGGIELGVAIGRFAAWHFGGRQPANLLSVIGVAAITHDYRGDARITFSDGTTITYPKTTTLYKLTCKVTR